MSISGAIATPRVLAGAYDLTAFLKSFRLVYGAEMLDASVFGQSTRVFRPGVKQVSYDAEGLMPDLTTDAAESFMNGLVGGSVTPVTLMPTNTPVEGSLAYFFSAMHGAFNRGAPAGQLYNFTMHAESGHLSAYPLVRGYVLEPGSVARIVSGAGTGTNGPGAVGAAQYAYAALHVFAASAGDTLDVIIQSDADGNFAAGASTRFTFTQVTAIGSQYMTRLAGPITDTYWRVSWTIGGVDPSFTFAVVVGIV